MKYLHIIALALFLPFLSAHATIMPPQDEQKRMPTAIDNNVIEKAAYILCPDGTMIQPGEKCPEKADVQAPGDPIPGIDITIEQGTKATDYNSSRSNNNGSSAAFDGDTDEPEPTPTAGYIKIGDIKGESEDKAAYILCPDGTMIQPGEKCPEKADIESQGDPVPGIGITIEQGTKATDYNSSRSNKNGSSAAFDGDTDEPEPTPAAGYIKIGDIKGEVCNAKDNDCDSQTDDETSRKNHLDDDDDGDSIDTRANHNTTRSNKTQPISNPDNEEDGETEDKAAYILCPDGTMIQPGEKCPEKNATNFAVLLEGGSEIQSHELTHVVQQVAPRVVVNNNAVEEKKEKKGEMIVEIPGTETQKVLGLFKINLNVNVQLDAEGNLIKVKRPWYSFLSW